MTPSFPAQRNRRLTGRRASMLMPISRGQPVFCPACGVEIAIPLQARLRAQEGGTAISCLRCQGTWLLKLHPEPEFLPLSTPKRKRGPKRYHPDAEP